MATHGALSIWITADQVSPWNSALAGVDRARASVLMIESIAQARSRRHHKRKLVLWFAAMRAFAAELRRAGWDVDYHAECDDSEAALAAHIRRYRPQVVRMMQQSDRGPHVEMTAAVAALGVALEVTPHANFVSDAAEFERLFRGGKTRVTMETFYRAMRLKTGILMDGSQPAGGSWNFDAENRRPPRAGMRFPAPLRLPQRAEVIDAIATVERRFGDHPGTTRDFDLPVTREDALAYAEDFFAHRLDEFGPYEDAMIAGEPTLNHSRLSAAVNLGLLHPLELCRRAEACYRAGTARLQSVEGFVRQVIGWREFVWQTYWKHGPEYRERNALGAELPLPAAYASGRTSMRCVSEALRWTHEQAYAHHILRLMVLGNFALVAGVDPQATNDWFWEMFADGYEWVMVPNVIGMTLHADGGIVGTKPYAASGAYIDRMSDYCKGCRYDRKSAENEDSCPFNALYWDFLARHEQRFAKNVRMSVVMRAWSARPDEWKRSVRARAATLRDRLRAGDEL